MPRYPEQWLCEFAFEINHLTEEFKHSRPRFHAKILEYSREDDERDAQREKTTVEVEISPGEFRTLPTVTHGNDPEIDGVPPLFLGPKPSIAAKYAALAAIHDVCLEEVCERAAKTIQPLSPWTDDGSRRVNLWPNDEYVATECTSFFVLKLICVPKLFEASHARFLRGFLLDVRSDLIEDAAERFPRVKIPEGLPPDWDVNTESPAELTPRGVFDWIESYISILEEWQGPQSLVYHLRKDTEIGNAIVRNAFRLLRILEQQGFNDLPDEPLGDFDFHGAAVVLRRLLPAFHQIVGVRKQRRPAEKTDESGASEDSRGTEFELLCEGLTKQQEAIAGILYGKKHTTSWDTLAASAEAFRNASADNAADDPTIHKALKRMQQRLSDNYSRFPAFLEFDKRKRRARLTIIRPDKKGTN